MNTPTQQQINNGIIIAEGVAPLLPPNAQLALALAIGALNAVQAAQNSGADITDAQLANLFSLDDQAKAADQLAQQKAVGP